MNLIWTYETYWTAIAHYRELLCDGHRARMWLAYAGPGNWRVAAW